MNISDLIIGYFKGLFQRWILVVLMVFDVLGAFVQPFIKVDIPLWGNLIVFILLFLFANFLLYRDSKDEIRRLKDHYEIQISRLKEKIAAIEIRQPRLDLLWKGGELSRKVELRVKPLPGKPDYDELIKREEAELKNAYAQRKSTSPKIPNLKIDMLGGHKTLEEYEIDCKNYLEEYREYLEHSYYMKFYSARYRHLYISLLNSGNTPGEGIVIVLDFPEEFHFLDDEHEYLLLYQDGLEPPQRPSITKNLFGNFNLIPTIRAPLTPFDLSATSQQLNVRGPHITRKNSTEVRFEVDNILHNMTEDEFDPIEFLVTDEAVGHSWEVPFNIHAGNLPEPVRDSLIIEVVLDELKDDKSNQEEL